MLNANQVQESVYKLLANRQRVNSKTDLTQFTKYVKGLLSEATEADVLAVFKEFEKKGYGSLIMGRKDNPNRFVWGFNLKEVAQNALGLKSETLKPIEKIYKKRGPKPKHLKAVPAMPIPVKKSRKPRTIKASTPAKKAGTMITINLELGQNVRPEDIQALISLANSLK